MKKKWLEVKNIVTEMKRAFDYQKKHAEERTAELNNISIETSKTENLREQGLEKQNRICKDCGTTIKVAICLMGNQKEERKEQ